VKGGTFTWHQAETNATTEMTYDQLTIEAPDRASPVKIAGQGQFQHKPYRFEAQVGALATLQEAGEPYPVKLDGEIARTRIAIDGARSRNRWMRMGIDLNVAVDGRDLQEFLAVFTVPLPSTPAIPARRRVTHDDNKWGVDKLDGRVGNSGWRVGVEVDVGGKIPIHQGEPRLELSRPRRLQGLHRRRAQGAEAAQGRGGRQAGRRRRTRARRRTRRPTSGSSPTRPCRSRSCRGSTSTCSSTRRR